MLPVCYALTSAMVGTQSVVQAKCLSEIVSILLDGMGGGSGGDAAAPADAPANASAVAAPLPGEVGADTRGAGEIVFTSWFTYFVIGYFLVSVGFWLYRLQSALSKYDPLFIIPLLQASYIVFATIGRPPWLKRLLPHLRRRPRPPSPPRLSVERARRLWAARHSQSEKIALAHLKLPTPLPPPNVPMQAVASTSRSYRRWRRISGSSSRGASS